MPSGSIRVEAFNGIRDMKVIAKNKRAFHEFEILAKLEAGVSLQGSEVKSLRTAACSIAESHVRIRRDEAFIFGMNIPPYKAGGYANHEATRPRKLLIHRAEIKKLYSRVSEKGYTLVPLRVYFNKRGLVKIEIGLARGKKLHDKRESIKKREMGREIEKAMRRNRR